MATGQTIREVVQARVRGSSHTDAQVLTLIAHAQQILGVITGSIYKSSNFSIPSAQTHEAVTAIASASTIARFREVEVDGRRLDRIPFDALKRRSLSWLSIKGEPREFATLGFELFFLFPKPSFEAVTVEAKGPATTDVSAFSDATVITLPDRFFPHLLDLTEVLMLIRERRPASGRVALDRLKLRLQELVT